MLCYLVYDANFKLYEVFENIPQFSYDFGWLADGWHDIVSIYDIPDDTKEVLAEKGILKVYTSPKVLFHLNESVHKEEEGV